MIRLLATLCAAAVVLLPSAAWAYAPMCDENAQTIDAPLPLYPSKGGEISAGQSCENDGSLLGSVPQQDPSRPLLAAENIDRALARGAPIPPCARSSRLRMLSDARGAARSGATRDVFRPPRV